MGKSPGKWIKTLLFGKKSSRSNASKKYANGKEGDVKNGGNSPVISYPLPVTTNQCANSDSQKETSSNLHSDGIARLPVQEEAENGSTDFCKSETLYTNKEEQAAVIVQAAFRGYLARRAFHALCGIIRLQALYRGHLVRRQAVVSLRCIQGIVKFQAIVRGQKVRQSDIGLEVHTVLLKSNSKGAKHVACVGRNLPCHNESPSSNRFASKLLSSPAVSKPLQMQYTKGQPNSLWSWLERWSSIQFWKPASLPKKPIDFKPKTRLGGYALETESGKLKRGPRKAYSPDNGSIITASESEKSKRGLRKINIPSAEPVQEQPQSELEKVKRNLRKITSSYAQASDLADGENERSKRTIKSVVSSQVDGPELPHSCSSEKATKDDVHLSQITLNNVTIQLHDLEIGTSMETDQKPASDTKPEELPAVKLLDEDVTSYAENNTNILSESHLLLDDEKTSPINGQLTPQEESEETLKMSKRRASFSAKLENAENGLVKTPSLPSYMAATESAKAKLRGQTSPRFSSDAIDKNGFVRRHSLPSLPSSINGKLGQKPGQNILKMGRDQPIRAEWKR